MHEIAVWLGLTNGSGPQYLFWSGICGDLVYLSALGLAYRHFNCHADGCKRLGFHHVIGTPLRTCRRHHPTGGNTEDDIRDAHEAAQ